MAYGNMQMNMGMPGNVGNPGTDMPRWLQMMQQRMGQANSGVMPAGSDMDMAKLLGLVPQGYMPGAGRNPYGPMGRGMMNAGGMGNQGMMAGQPMTPGMAPGMQEQAMQALMRAKQGGVQGNNMLRGMGGIGLGGGMMMMNPSVMGR